MIVKQYDPCFHEEAAIYLLQAHGMKPSYVSDLPQFGFMVLKEETELPIAMGFLRLFEGNCAVMDSFITNPECSSQDRDQALDQLVLGLTALAKDLDLKGLFAFSEHQSLIDRTCKRHGWTNRAFHFSSINLNKDGFICPFSQE